MSPEARAKIGAAQKKRWAKARKAAKSGLVNGTLVELIPKWEDATFGSNLLLSTLQSDQSKSPTLLANHSRAFLQAPLPATNPTPPPFDNIPEHEFFPSASRPPVGASIA